MYNTPTQHTDYSTASPSPPSPLSLTGNTAHIATVPSRLPDANHPQCPAQHSCALTGAKATAETTSAWYLSTKHDVILIAHTRTKIKMNSPQAGHQPPRAPASVFEHPHPPVPAPGGEYLPIVADRDRRDAAQGTDVARGVHRRRRERTVRSNNAHFYRILI